MRLTKIVVENFRGYRHRTEVEIGDLTSIIGKNDVGKSTIMEALGIFFECADLKIDGSDVNVHGREEDCAVSCIFEGPFAPLVIDAQAETTLVDEHLLNEDGKLEIEKRWNCSAAKPACSVYVRAQHPSAEGAGGLLELTNAKLKARAKEVGVDLGSKDVNAASNVSLRLAIRSAVGDLQLTRQQVSLKKEGGKEVWAVLQKRLPAFALFRSDRPSRDDDPEAADPMKLAVREAIKAVEDDLDKIREAVRRRVVDVADRTLAKVREMAPELASELNPTFRSEPSFDGFKMALTGDEDIPINKRGSGVRRLILLNFFRAEAERVREQGGHPGIIYAIEEPETSLHPDMQRMLIGALQELSEAGGTQVLLTTHAPELTSLLPSESIRFIAPGEDGFPGVDGGEKVLQRVADALGVLPDVRQRPKVLLYVEGPNDVVFLEHIGALLRQADPNLVCIKDDDRVAVVTVGGGTLKQWVERDYLGKLGCASVHVYDRDEAQPPKYQAQVDVLNERERTYATFTKKREMENYLHSAAIETVLNVRLEIADHTNVPDAVASAIHVAASPTSWDEVSEKKQQSKAKRRLNGEAAASMTLEMLQERDPHDEVQGWFEKMTEFAES